MDVAGQAALVSGGASGLGAATARHLAAEGAEVAVLDFDGEGAAKVAKEIGGHAFEADVSDEAAIESALYEIVDRLGRAPRIVLNCAGIGHAARIVGREGKTSTDVFRRVIGINLIGTYNVMTYAVKALMETEPLTTGERGIIVNTSSAAYEDGQVGQSAYAASKGAIASMCLPLARELAKPGIRVMAIAPGLFRTPMMESLPEETTAEIVKNIPFPHRLGQPDEFARLVAHIVENPYMNGTVIRLDGAVRLPPR